MIVTREGDCLEVITQPDHARFSGELLSLWTSDGLPQHRFRAELLLAAREHDNGWREADAAPFLHPSGLEPFDFLSIPSHLRVEIWQRGTARFEDSHPLVALLITQHSLTLHRNLHDEDPWVQFLAGLEERRASLMERTGIDEATLEAAYRWIELTDLLSLVACNRWHKPFHRSSWAGRLEESTLYVNPFPLAGTTTFAIPCRRIPRRRYSGDRDLAMAMARARWESRAVRVKAGP